MNNGTTLTSFKERYTKLYNKNKDTFPEFSVIISEFACGSGGDTSGALGRNAASQAKWVEDMFKEFNAAEKRITSNRSRAPFGSTATIPQPTERLSTACVSWIPTATLTTISALP